jgi:hypothetical protein
MKTLLKQFIILDYILIFIIIRTNDICSNLEEISIKAQFKKSGTSCTGEAQQVMKKSFVYIYYAFVIGSIFSPN